MAEQIKSFLRIKQVKAVTGMSRSWLYEAIRQGNFPAPYSLSANGRAVGWNSEQISAWVDSRIQARGAK